MKRPVLLAALLLAACNSDIAPQFRVKDVRVLAVRSGVTAGRSADVAPGDTLVLDALVANPLGRSGFSVNWFACPPTASEAVSPCADLASVKDPARFITLATGPDPSVLYLGSGPSVRYPVPALAEALDFVIETAKREPSFACRMYAEIMVVVIASAEGRYSLAVKSVRVRPSADDVAAAGLPDLYALNLNPTISGVIRAPTDAYNCTGGTAVNAAPFPAGTTILCGRGSASEQYNLCDPGLVTQVSEELWWQWYVSDGDFPEEGGVGNATGTQVDFTRPAGPFTLWAILRDGRGGTDWVSFAISTL